MAGWEKRSGRKQKGARESKDEEKRENDGRKERRDGGND